MELHPRMLRSGHCAHPDTRQPDSSHLRCGGYQQANPEKLVQLCPCGCHYGDGRTCALCGRALVLAQTTPEDLGEVWVHVETETGLSYFAVNCPNPEPDQPLKEEAMVKKIKKSKKDKTPKEPKLKKGKKSKKDKKAKEMFPETIPETEPEFTLAEPFETYECGCERLIAATTIEDTDGDPVYVHVDEEGEIIGGPDCTALFGVHV